MKQYTETQIAIMSAFEKMLGEMRFKKISVQEILNRASISRSQFYRLFTDKYDLLEHTIAYQYSRILTDDYTQEELPEKLTSLFRMFGARRAVLSIQHQFDDATLGRLLFESNVRQYCRRHEQLFQESISEDKMRALRFVSAGYAALIFDWLHEKETVPLHEIFFRVKYLAPAIMMGPFLLSPSESIDGPTDSEAMQRP